MKKKQIVSTVFSKLTQWNLNGTPTKQQVTSLNIKYLFMKLQLCLHALWHCITILPPLVVVYKAHQLCIDYRLLLLIIIYCCCISLVQAPTSVLEFLRQRRLPPSPPSRWLTHKPDLTQL